MTRAEQDTERALLRAEGEWLEARGWTRASGYSDSLLSGARWSHTSLFSPIGYKQRDALALTRAEPLRFRRR